MLYGPPATISVAPKTVADVPARFATLDIFVANHLPPFKLYVGVVNKLNPVMPPSNLLAALTPLNIAPPGAPN